MTLMMAMLICDFFKYNTFLKLLIRSKLKMSVLLIVLFQSITNIIRFKCLVHLHFDFSPLSHRH
jgi:hypothetical protein